MAAFSQAVSMLIACKGEERQWEVRERHTALEGRLLSTAASGFRCAYALAVVASAASHVDGGCGVVLLIGVSDWYWSSKRRAKGRLL